LQDARKNSRRFADADRPGPGNEILELSTATMSRYPSSSELLPCPPHPACQKNLSHVSDISSEFSPAADAFLRLNVLLAIYNNKPPADDCEN
jgi:hypothetical protein